MLSPESQEKTNEELCLGFESIDQIKCAQLTLNYYITHVIIMLSLWSSRERSQVMESEVLATWASLRSCLVSYSKGEAELFLHHPKQWTPHQKFREHLISSVSSGTQYSFLYSLIEYLLWSFAMQQQNGNTTAISSYTCAFTLYQQCEVVAMETSWPAKLKIFTLWPFTGPEIKYENYCFVIRI